MGLDCTHDAFVGSYAAFDRLRRAVCEAVGGNWPPHTDPSLDQEKWYVPDGFDLTKNAGLALFLNHSDCSGSFTPEQCLLVARDLERHFLRISEEYGTWRAAYGSNERIGARRAALRFARGCRRAAAAGELLEFR